MSYRALLWHFLLFHLPFKGVTFLRPYLDFVRQLTLLQDGRLRQRALLLYPIGVAYLLHNVYLWNYRPSSLSCILHVDLAMVAFQTPLFYPCICGFALQALCMYRVLFMNLGAPFISLLEEMFFRKRSSLLEGLTYGALPARQATWRMLQLVISSLQLTILFLGKLLAGFGFGGRFRCK